MSGRFYDPTEPVQKRSGGNLPHWRQDGAMYFVTFRLADSLPEDKLKELRFERQTWLETHPEPWTPLDRRLYYKRFVETIHEWLDQSTGSCILRVKEHREIVESAVQHFEGPRYALGDFVVAPNHVHVVVTPAHGHSLSAIEHSWKSYTSNQLSRIPSVSEAFSEFWKSAATTQRMSSRSRSIWQKESYDHIVRDQEDLDRIQTYIQAHK